MNSGVEFVGEEFMDTIPSIYARGEYFDTAVILESSWTKGRREEFDSVETRRRIYNFAEQISRRNQDNISIVFIAHSRESASTVYTEILSIRDKSTVIIADTKLRASLLKDLILGDLSCISEENIFVPVDDMDIEEELFDDQFEIEYNTDFIENFADEISTDTDENAFDLHNIDIDSGGVTSNTDNLVVNTEVSNESFDSFFDDADFESDVEVENWDVELYTDETSKSGSMEIECGDFTLTDITNNDSEDASEINVIDKDILNIEESLSVSNIATDDGIGDLFKATIGIKPDVEDIKDNITSDIDIASQFSSDMYSKNTSSTAAIKMDTPEMRDDQLKTLFDALASRGNTIVVTGPGGSGTSTVAYNIANTIHNLGYTVCLVDMDTEGRTQSYISKDNFSFVNYDPSNMALKSALNASVAITKDVSIVKPGFNLLTMGLGCDAVKLDTIVDKNKLFRFASMIKSSYNFIVYDIPFEYAIGCASDIVYLSDSILFVAENSNWGLTKTMLDVCNIESSDMQDKFFADAQLLLNKHRGFNKLMGKRVKGVADVLRVMDDMVESLTGIDPGYHFSNLKVAGLIDYDASIEECWYADKQYTDSLVGHEKFTDIIKRLLLKI